MTKRSVLFIVAFLMLAGVALAQDAEPIEINPAIVEAILAFTVGGLGASQLTELVKRLIMKAIPQGGNVVGLASNAIVSAGLTAAFLAATGSFALVPFIIYTALVFGGATGLFKMVHKPS